MALSLIILIAVSSWASAADDMDGWVTYNSDAQRRGLTPVDTTHNWGGYTWVFSPRYGDVTCQPLVDGNGTVYFTTTSGALFAINPNGTERWRRDAGDRDRYVLGSMPVIGPSGVIYMTTSWGALQAYHPNGTELWSYPFGYDEIHWSEQNPCIGPDGTIYVTTLNRELLAVHPNGTLKWSVSYKGLTGDSYISLGLDGTIYVNTGHIHAFAPDGEFLWNHTEESLFYGHVIVAGSDTVYAATSYGRVKCLDGDGNVRWSVKLLGEIVTSPSLDWEGNVLIGTTEGILYALDWLGNEVWSSDVVYPVSSTPVMSKEGIVYLATQSSRFFAVRPGDGIKWSQRIVRLNMLDPYHHYEKRSGVSLGPNGTVYFGGYGYDVYAFGQFLERSTTGPLTGNGLVPTPWPMEGGDEQRTGRTGSDLNIMKAQVLWSTTLEGMFGYGYWKYWTKTPSIGPSGTLYIIVKDQLYALGEDGNVVWNTSIGSGDWYSPAVSEDETVYVSGEDGKLIAIDNSGSILWDLTLGRHYISAPSVSDDGTVYVTDGNQSLIAVNPDGTVRWSLVVGNVYGPVTIGHDGTIYLLLYLIMLAITPIGEVQWSLDLREYSMGSDYGMISPGPSSLVVGDDGTIYFCNGYKLIAVSPEGEEKWVFDDGDDVEPNSHNRLTMPPPAVAADGTLILGGHHERAYGLNSDGEVLWTVDLDGPVEGQPLVGAGGSTFLVTQYKLYAIDVDGKKRWSNSFGANEGWFFGVSAGEDDHIYAIHSELGLLHIGADESGVGGNGNGGDGPLGGVLGPNESTFLILIVVLVFGVVIILKWGSRRKR